MLEKPEILNNNAINLAANGQYKEAIACIKRAITLDRENTTLWFNLGVTYCDFGNIKEAKKAFSQAYNLDKYNKELLETYATTCLMAKNN
jgi:Flp pilus assembly protein TadD